MSRALKRLLRVRSLEEEQQRAALESALAQLHWIERSLEECAARERRGRQLAVTADDTAERLAGRVEIETAQRTERALLSRRVDAQREAALRREAFLHKRIERRQAETLLQEAEARRDAVAAHRAQQGQDEWHAARRDQSARQPAPEDEGIVSKPAPANSDSGKEFPL